MLHEALINGAAPLWDPSGMNESSPHEIPLWLGGESGQRKRYLRSLEQDLIAELGPDWREKLERKSEETAA